MTTSSIPPICAQLQAGMASSGIASLQSTNASLVLGFLTAAQENASIREVSESLGRLEPALDAVGASRAATITRRLMRSQETPNQADWLNAAHDHIGTIINDGIPARESKGQKKGMTLVELLAESPEAMDHLMGDSTRDSELHDDFASRARQLWRLLDENQSPRVRTMDASYKNAVLFILEMEPHIPEMLALDDTLNFLSAGVWEISAAVYGQMEAADLVYDRLRIALSRLYRAGIEDKFEEGIGRAYEQADKLQGRIQEIDLAAPVSVPPPSFEGEEEPAETPEDLEVLPSERARLERDRSRVTLGELLATKPGAPLAKIRSLLRPATRPSEDIADDNLAARTVQSLIDSLDILLESLRDG